jgi:hypothetical protein
MLFPVQCTQHTQTWKKKPFYGVIKFPKQGKTENKILSDRTDLNVEGQSKELPSAEPLVS